MSISRTESRTFQPYHVSNAISRILVRGLVPALGFVAGIFAIWFCVKLTGFLPADLTEDERATAIPIITFLGLVVVSIPLSLFALWYYLDREFFRHTVSVDSDGIIQRKGAREDRCAWSDIQRVTTFGLGRMQIATVHHARGKIRFDAGMVEAHGPQPRRVLDLRNEYLQYPDGARQPLTIESNRLYALVCERAPRGTVQSAGATR